MGAVRVRVWGSVNAGPGRLVGGDSVDFGLWDSLYGDAFDLGELALD
jgi:hypothetical protein